MLAAYRGFRDQAADFTAVVEGELERQRYERLGIDASHWFYRHHENPGGIGYFLVWQGALDGLDRADSGGDKKVRGRTAREAHDAFISARVQVSHLTLRFGAKTQQAMEEWRGSATAAWREITGDRDTEWRLGASERYPDDPHRDSPKRFGAPSVSSYQSLSDGGYDGGGYSGGGFSGFSGFGGFTW